MFTHASGMPRPNQVRSRPLGGTANPAFVDQYIFTDLNQIPPFQRRYVDVEGLSPGKGFQVRHLYPPAYAAL